eukprot:7871017-Karenia_brevis.AAC.1
MFKAIQEEEEEPPEMVESSDEEEEEEEDEKECSALFWEEDQELSPLMCGNEWGEWEILTVTVDSGAADSVAPEDQ